MGRVVLGQEHFQFRVFAHAGFGQHFFGLVRIIGVKIGKILVIGIAVIHEGSNGLAPAPDHVQHLLFVNGVGDGLAHLEIVQGRPAAIHGHDHDQGGQFFLDLDIRAAI